MNKEFCTYKQALALEELGFNEPCMRGWYEDGGIWYHPDSDIILDNPTFSQAFRWFREKYQLFTLVGVRSISPFKIFWSITDSHGNELQGCIVYFNTYEEAESACLDKLIEIKTNSRLPTPQIVYLPQTKSNNYEQTKIQ